MRFAREHATVRESHGTSGGGEARRCARSFAEENFFRTVPWALGLVTRPSSGEKRKQSATQRTVMALPAKKSIRCPGKVGFVVIRGGVQDPG